MPSVKNYIYFKYAPMTSVDVERVFSKLKWILSDQRHNLEGLPRQSYPVRRATLILTDDINESPNSTLYCKGEKCVILAEVQFEARGLQCAEDKIASLPNVGRDCGGCKYCNKQFTATKSRSLYDIAYNRFKKNYKSSTLWAQYSMVKSCLIIYDNIDISKFPKLIAFLKRTGDGYQAKKIENIDKE
ncbi:hypothetical protein NQ317_000573 [Molorchus minor]|uniref:Uncharacterized protein n=1 Tax=Molorchus minor TaxID=1323400 RepID=A0ABQ9IYB9_9CUCU|nr:hypothetical protein NQ317_000573 [Molorchus minor]